MAITTLDGAIAGFQPPVAIAKAAGATMAAVGAMRGFTPWYSTGNPGASTATSVGVNGEAVTPALGSTNGRIYRVNPGSGNAYLARLSMASSQTGTLWLIDRVWQNSGLSVTSTTAQAISPATIPSRDADGTTNGRGIMAAVEWSATGGAGTPVVTLTYTASDGTTGRTATLNAVTTPPVGTFEIFSLATGDFGVRAPTSFIQSATRTSGTMHLVLFRLIASVECPVSNVANAVDVLTSGMPRIYNDSTLQLLWFPTGTTAMNLTGMYIETQG